jgi:putative ABC transport system permease protein
MFVLKMAWRDSRAARRRLLLCALSVVFGVAALVALDSLAAGVARAIRVQAKGLLGADLVVTGRTPPDPALQRYLDGLSREQAHDVSFTSMMAFPTDGNATRLVQVRAMGGGFPFYGELETEPADARARLRAGGNVAILDGTLLSQFNAKVGDTVKLGRSTFTVVGALKRMPGDSLGLSLLAPRALIPGSALAATGLADRGGLVRYLTALKLSGGPGDPAVVAGLEAKFPNDGLSFETAESRERDLGRTLENIHRFLSLVGFSAILLGAIGMASALHVYVRQKIATVAVLRCLGASARQGFSIYLTQGVALGVFGALLGAAAGVAFQFAIQGALANLLPFRMDFFIAWPEVVRGMAAGLAVGVLFTLLPLLPIRRVPPLAALRAAEGEPTEGAADPWRAAVIALIAVAVSALAASQMRSVRLGLAFSGMLAAGFGVLLGAARLATWAARRLPRRRWPYPVRQGIANLHRPNNRTALLVLSLGLGTSLILTVYLARATLLREIDQAGWSGRSNLIFFDIQTDQIKPLDRLLAAEGAPVALQAPIVTMKISALRGRPVEELRRDRAAPLPDWTLRREYRSTYRGATVGTERVVAGKFEGRAVPGAATVPISMEEGLFRDMRLKLGDEIDWDVQGLPLRTRVTSVRAVEWRRLEPNFFVVFPEGVLEAAPQFYVLSVRAATPADSARLQRAVVAAFPNVTAIDLTFIMQMLDGIFSKVAFAVDFMAAFTVATGLAVLAGAVVSGRRQRRREIALLRTLGATGRQLARIEAVESGLLGCLGGIIGCALAAIANAMLAKFVFHTAPAAPPLAFLAALVAATAVTLAAGRMADFGEIRRSPLEALRAEG